MGLPEQLLHRGYKVLTSSHLPGHSIELTAEYENLYWPFGQHMVSSAKLIAAHPNLYAVYLILIPIQNHHFFAVLLLPDFVRKIPKPHRISEFFCLLWKQNNWQINCWFQNGISITTHGCGPDTMISHLFRKEMGDKPYLEIEVDEHDSTVGVITRVEAFHTHARAVVDVASLYENTQTILSLEQKRSPIPTLYLGFEGTDTTLAQEKLQAFLHYLPKEELS